MNEKAMLFKIAELLETQNELLNESNILKGEMLSSLDEIKNRLSTNDYDKPMSMPPQLAEVIPNPDINYIDSIALSKAIDNLDAAEVSVFWPKIKTKKGWARVSIKHPSLDSLTARIAKGCLCGKNIVIKKTENAEFFTCEGVIKGRCDYRPAIYADKMTFLTNLPPK